MTNFIKISRTGPVWEALRISEYDLQNLELDSSLVGIIPEFDTPIPAVWVKNVIDENMGTTTSISIETASPPNWKATGDADEMVDGVMIYRPVRSTAENYATFCRMILVTDEEDE